MGEPVIAHADELAMRFESYEPTASDEIDIGAVADLRRAVAEQSAAERHLISAIRSARAANMSWNTIGTFVGTSGEAVRQRYTQLVA